MTENTKWLNTRLPVELKKRYENALELAKNENKRHISSPQIMVPAIEAFCEAAENGKSREFLNGKWTSR